MNKENLGPPPEKGKKKKAIRLKEDAR